MGIRQALDSLQPGFSAFPQAGNGKDGWTDQERDNSLDSVPGEAQSCRGRGLRLYIRPDMNGEKSCIILYSRSGFPARLLCGYSGQ